MSKYYNTGSATGEYADLSTVWHDHASRASSRRTFSLYKKVVITDKNGTAVEMLVRDPRLAIDIFCYGLGFEKFRKTGKYDIYVADDETFVKVNGQKFNITVENVKESITAKESKNDQ